MSTYPLLQQFFNAYMYDGFHEEFGDESGALEAFISPAPKDAPSFQAEITELLRRNPAESQVSHVVWDELGANIDVTRAGLTWREWLTRLSDEAGRLAAHPGAA